MSRATAIDWLPIRLRYVNSAISLRDVAAEFGVTASAVMKRSEREGWERERQQLSANVSIASQAALSTNRADELVRFNEDDLKVAKALRVMVARTISDWQSNKQGLSATEMSALARTADTAQKIGRLALGAETANTVVGMKSLPASVDDFV